MSVKNTPTFLRQQLFVEHGVQGALLARTALYSSACAIYFVVILLFTESMSRPEESMGQAAIRCLDEAIYWGPGLLLLAPLIAYDLLKLTNRFAGPIFRLRREMKRLAAGESEHALNFRDGDYWTEMAEVFNELRGELIELRQMKAEFASSKTELAKTGSNRQLFVTDAETAANEFMIGNSV